MADLYPGRTAYMQSSIPHALRSETRGVVVHWTAGTGDFLIPYLAGRNSRGVDVHFLVMKDGRVYQFVDGRSWANHAFHTANSTCVGIEHECRGAGDPWTEAQTKASADLCRWICDTYGIPVRKVDPVSSADGPSWHGLFGHRDLAGIDGNDHPDTITIPPGWDRFLSLIRNRGFDVPDPQPPAPLPAGQYGVTRDVFDEAMPALQGARNRVRAVAENFGPVLAQYDRAAAERMVDALLECYPAIQFGMNAIAKRNASCS